MCVGGEGGVGPSQVAEKVKFVKPGETLPSRKYVKRQPGNTTVRPVAKDAPTAKATCKQTSLSTVSNTAVSSLHARYMLCSISSGPATLTQAETLAAIARRLLLLLAIVYGQDRV